MRLKIKERLRNIRVVSIRTLTYENEMWILRSQDRRRLETSQMHFMRALAGKT